MLEEAGDAGIVAKQTGLDSKIALNNYLPWSLTWNGRFVHWAGNDKAFGGIRIACESVLIVWGLKVLAVGAAPISGLEIAAVGAYLMYRTIKHFGIDEMKEGLLEKILHDIAIDTLPYIRTNGTELFPKMVKRIKCRPHEDNG